MGKKTNPQRLNWHILLRLFRFARPYRLHFALTWVNVVQGVAIDFVRPYLLQSVVDSVATGQMRAFARWLFVIGAVLALVVVLNPIGRRATTRYLNYTVRDLRDQVTAHVQRLPIAYLDSFHSGDLASRLSADVDSASAWLATVLELTAQPLLFLGGIIYMLTISWKLLLVSFILTPASAFLINQLSKPIESHSRKLAEEKGRINAALQDAIAGITMVKAFNLRGWLGDAFKARVKAHESETLKISWQGTLTFPVYMALRFAPQLITPLYGGFLAYRGEITVGQLLAANALVWTVYSPIQQMLGMLSQVRETVPRVERIYALLDQPAEFEDDERAFVPVPGATPVELIDVDFGYQSDDGEIISVLQGLDLHLLPGQTVALVGPSGCGKSTLLKLLCGFYHPQRGRVCIQGNDLAESDLATARAQVSLVSQHTYLFPVTIAENIGYGRPGATEGEIVAAAKAANAHDFVLEQPQGYQTQVGERGVRLSGGQRQRIALARAILKDAPILLLDEPTSALDTQSEALVQQALDRFAAGRTALIVAHRLSTIRDADRILVLDQGRVCEQGTHASLMRQDGLYRRLVQKQAADGELQGDIL